MTTKQIPEKVKRTHPLAQRLLQSLSLLASFVSSLAAADLPVGIPTPPFGLSETVESIYGDRNYYTHWVDNTHVNATDSSNPNGSPARPRLTLPSLASLPAGSVVQLRGGPYQGSQATVGGQGTAERPIFIRGASSLHGVSASASTDTLVKPTHGLETGARIYITFDEFNTGFGGLTKATVPYYVIRISDSTFKLANSPGNAASGTAIDITSDGIEGVVTEGPEFRFGFDIAANTRYMIIENINWNGLVESVIDFFGSGSPGGTTIHDVAIRGCDFTGNGQGQGNTSGSTIASHVNNSTDSAYNLVYLRNSIHDYSRWQSPTTQQDCIAFSSSTRTHDVWILWNRAYHMAGDAIGTAHDSNHSVYRYFIGGNTFYECGENAIDFKEIHSFVISENTCYGFASSVSSSGEAIVIHYGPTTGEGPYDAWIINNRIFGSQSGIVSTALNSEQSSTTWWIGNVVYDCTTALYPDRGGGHFKIFGNTIDECTNGIRSTGVVTSLELRGNIITNCTMHLQVGNSTVRTATTVSNELYWNQSGNVQIDWGNTYTSVSNWRNSTGAGVNSLQVDPRYTSRAARNYTLAPGSPAIDAGFDWSGRVTEFAERFNASLLYDVTRLARPLGSGMNIGAHENGSEIGLPADPGALVATP